MYPNSDVWNFWISWADLSCIKEIKCGSMEERWASQTKEPGKDGKITYSPFALLYLFSQHPQGTQLLTEQWPRPEEIIFPPDISCSEASNKTPTEALNVLERGWNLESGQVLVHNLLTMRVWVSFSSPFGGMGTNNPNLTELLGPVI